MWSDAAREAAAEARNKQLQRRHKPGLVHSFMQGVKNAMGYST